MDRAKLLGRVLDYLYEDNEVYLSAIGQEIPKLLDVVEILSTSFGVDYELTLLRENRKIKIVAKLWR